MKLYCLVTISFCLTSFIITSQVYALEQYQFVRKWGSHCNLSVLRSLISPPADGCIPNPPEAHQVGDGQFKIPKNIAIDHFGTIYVTDDNNARVEKFDSHGIFVTKRGSFCPFVTELSYPEFSISPDPTHCNNGAPRAHEVGDGQFNEPMGLDPILV